MPGKRRKRKRATEDDKEGLTLSKGQELIYAQIYQTCLCLPADVIALVSSYASTLMVGEDVLFTDYDARTRSLTARFPVPMDAKSYFHRTRQIPDQDLPTYIRRLFPFFYQPTVDWHGTSLKLLFQNNKEWLHIGYTLFSPGREEIRGFRCFFPRFSPHFHFLCDLCKSGNVQTPRKTIFVNGVAFFLCQYCEEERRNFSICHLCGVVSNHHEYLYIGFRDPMSKQKITVCQTCNGKLSKPLIHINPTLENRAEHKQHNRSILLEAGALISGQFHFTA